VAVVAAADVELACIEADVEIDAVEAVELTVAL